MLIEGEAGTGKEIVMRAVHPASLRSRKLLRIVNFGTVPVNSIESLLFGHEKGAFVAPSRARSARSSNTPPAN